MTTFIKNWFKQVFIHHASSDCSSHKKMNSIPTEHVNIDRNCLLDKTMSDADAMHSDDENRNFSLKNPIETKLLKKDITVIDKFQACFIDCTCQCEAKKVISQININASKDVKSQLFEELFDQIHGPSYEIDCCCDCGKKGIRKLKFNYATGNKISNDF